MTGGCWLCRRCWLCRSCWADESESLSLSRGLGMLGEELRLSWSMSLGSLLSSSLTLRPSELSPSPSPSHSEGESGRLSSCVLDFLTPALSGSSVSEAPFSRGRLALFIGEGASSLIFLLGFFMESVLLSVLSVLAALGEVRPLERKSSLVGEALPSGLVCFLRPLRSVDIEPRFRRVLMLCFPLSPSSSSLTGLNINGGGSTGFSMGGSSPYFLK